MFPENWTQSDLINYFRKFGPVFIRWIDNTSAFAMLKNQENATVVMPTIEKIKGVKVTPFAEYERATGARKEDVCIFKQIKSFDYMNI